MTETRTCSFSKQPGSLYAEFTSLGRPSISAKGELLIRDACRSRFRISPLATGTKGLALGIAAHLDGLLSEARGSTIFEGLGARVVAGPAFQLQ